jgi:cysteinyl-tRNA synthetase
LNYDEEHLLNARQALNRFYTALRGLPAVQPGGADKYVTDFNKAMDDDFNTPEALATLFELVREINKTRLEDEEKASAMAAELVRLGAILGVLQDDPEGWLKGGASGGLSDDEIENLIRQRKDAKTNRNWAEADRIRDELKDKGVVLEDGAGGTTWRRN